MLLRIIESTMEEKGKPANPSFQIILISEKYIWS